MNHASKTLTPEQADALGRELDALRQEVASDLGERDVAHIRKIIATARGAEAAGRVLLHIGIGPISFVLGTSALALAKILENMEIGHNVMHGQYDWTRDPELASQRYEWDIVGTADDWRHSHNYEHHTFTNVLGKDRDVGYMLLRVTPEQPWKPSYVVQPISATLLALFFQWGVGGHDLRLDEAFKGARTPRELAKRARALAKRAKPFLSKSAWQLFKDYGFFPALALGNAPRVFMGNLLANGARNLWTFAVIFCGHFPEGVRVYDESELEGESRGQWYARQMNGSANIDGGRWFHILTGHLSHQIEHHLFPDIPASRYPEMAPRVRAICEKYGQSYCRGTLRQQFGSVVRRILRLSLPGPETAPATAAVAPAGDRDGYAWNQARAA